MLILITTGILLILRSLTVFTILFTSNRYPCNNCEITFNNRNPFSSTREKLTYETKINFLKGLKHPEETYTSVAYRYNASPNKVIWIYDKHVNIPKKKLPIVLSKDEHYFPSSDNNAKYCCLLMDFSTAEILDVLPDRKKTYLRQYFSGIKHNSFNFKNNRS